MDNLALLDPQRNLRQKNGNGGGRDDIGERLARLEEKVEHLASKEDIQKLKVWILGGIVAGIVAGVPAMAGLIWFIVRPFIN